MSEQTIMQKKVRDYTDTEDRLDKKPSPFAWHSGAVIDYERYQPRKTEKLVSLFEKHLLDHDSVVILGYFSKYRFLNSYLVCLLHEKYRKDAPEEYSKKRLSNLFKLGLLSRFKISYIDNAKVKHSSPYIYCLSEKGSSLCSKEKTIVLDANQVLRRMAFNQYYISMERNYAKLLSHEYLFSEDGTSFDGTLAFSSGKDDLCFNVISVRSGDKPYGRLGEVFKRFSSEPTASFIILAESELAALEIESYRKKNKDFAEFTTLYLCDFCTFDFSKLLNNLMLIDDESCKTYSTIVIPINE